MSVGFDFSKHGTFVFKERASLKVAPTQLEALVCKVIPLDAIEQKIIHLRISAALSHKQISLSTGLSERSVKRVLENVISKIREPRVLVEEIL